MLKSFNIKGMLILFTILAIVHFGFAFFVSPMLKNVLIQAINKQAGTKILIAKVTVWPLTLTCTLKDLKIFNPEDESQRIVAIKSASLRISLMALLSKRVVVSRLSIVGAQINLKGEPDGSFNVQKLVSTKGKDQKIISKTTDIEQFKNKTDWFNRIYQLLKKESLKAAAKDKTLKNETTASIERKIQILPKGRRVLFIKSADQYLFEIKTLTIRDSYLKLEDDTGKVLNIDQVSGYIKNIVLDPSVGGKFAKLGIKGTFTQDNQPMGNFSLDYAQDYVKNLLSISCNLTANNMDLRAIESLYRDSLPVQFAQGTVNIKSQTIIEGDKLDSQNTVTLQNHKLNAINPNQTVATMVPLSNVCDALNQIDPLEMKVQITGSIGHPEFKGFQEMLIDMIKPYLKNVGKEAVKKGIRNVLGGFLKTN
jgi:uncharacterized protein involved in outer membrane biogenesis